MTSSFFSGVGSDFLAVEVEVEMLLAVAVAVA